METWHQRQIADFAPLLAGTVAEAWEVRACLEGAGTH